MTQATAKSSSEAKPVSSMEPEVIVNQDALIIGDKFYLMDDIADVEIKHMPWQYWMSCLSLLLAAYLYFFHPDALAVSGWSKKAYGVMVLVAAAFGAWGNSQSAQMVIGLPGKRIQVLERPEKELKEIRKKIMAFKKAAAAPQR